MPSAKGARNAAIWGAQTVQDGEKRVLGEYDTGYNEAKGYLRQGDEYYKPYADRYGAGSEAYSNALGLGGEAGNQSALGMFQSSPLARLMKDNAQQDSQGILRKASAGGMLNSGNTDTDVMSYMAGLYNKTYGDWSAWRDGSTRFANGAIEKQQSRQFGRTCKQLLQSARLNHSRQYQQHYRYGNGCVQSW